MKYVLKPAIRVSVYGHELLFRQARFNGFIGSIGVTYIYMIPYASQSNIDHKGFELYVTSRSNDV